MAEEPQNKHDSNPLDRFHKTRDPEEAEQLLGIIAVELASMMLDFPNFAQDLANHLLRICLAETHGGYDRTRRFTPRETMNEIVKQIRGNLLFGRDPRLNIEPMITGIATDDIRLAVDTTTALMISALVRAKEVVSQRPILL